MYKNEDEETEVPIDDEESKKLWLGRFYAKHAPEKLIHMETVLRRHSGNFSRLQEMLRSKYQSKKRKRVEEKEPTDDNDDMKKPEIFLQSRMDNDKLESIVKSSGIVYILRYVV